jgi:hypothetical protein
METYDIRTIIKAVSDTLITSAFTPEERKQVTEYNIIALIAKRCEISGITENQVSTALNKSLRQLISEYMQP